MKTQVYHCKGITEATDKANLYYIQVPTARRMEKEKNQITIYTRNYTKLAIFQY